MAGKRKSSVNKGIQATNIHAQSIAVGKGALAITNQYMDSHDADQVFVVLTQKVEELPEGTEKDVAESAIKALQAEAKLGEKAQESNVAKWLNFLFQAAPDIWDVAVASFENPVAGLGVAFRKVAERARQEKERARGEE